MLQFVPKSIWSPRRKQSPSLVPLVAGESLSITDSISKSVVQEAAGDERDAISTFVWEPETFTATTVDEENADLAIQFPSPKPQGNPDWDTAILDWHFARDRLGRITTAPAVIVLDILQGGNLVAGYIARTLSKNGLHAFILHLPQNGRRMKAGAAHDWNFFLPSFRQCASDARRARDVVASLPMVRGGVSLQGTSLGGFVATVAGGIDGIFDTNILALTGGDVYGILKSGKMDAIKVREELSKVGLTGSKLKDWLWQIEPLRVAHRLNPKKTWLFSARYDQVISAKHGKLLADKINLDWSHHRQLTGCHYTCAINAKRFLTEMTRAISRGAGERQSA